MGVQQLREGKRADETHALHDVRAEAGVLDGQQPGSAEHRSAEDRELTAWQRSTCEAGRRRDGSQTSNRTHDRDLSNSSSSSSSSSNDDDDDGNDNNNRRTNMRQPTDGAATNNNNT